MSRVISDTICKENTVRPAHPKREKKETRLGNLQYGSLYVTSIQDEESK